MTSFGLMTYDLPKFSDHERKVFEDVMNEVMNTTYSVHREVKTWDVSAPCITDMAENPSEMYTIKNSFTSQGEATVFGRIRRNAFWRLVELTNEYARYLSVVATTCHDDLSVDWIWATEDTLGFRARRMQFHLENTVKIANAFPETRIALGAFFTLLYRSASTGVDVFAPAPTPVAPAPTPVAPAPTPKLVQYSDEYCDFTELLSRIREWYVVPPSLGESENYTIQYRIFGSDKTSRTKFATLSREKFWRIAQDCAKSDPRNLGRIGKTLADDVMPEWKALFTKDDLMIKPETNPGEPSSFDLATSSALRLRLNTRSNRIRECVEEALTVVQTNSTDLGTPLAVQFFYTLSLLS